MVHPPSTPNTKLRRQTLRLCVPHAAGNGNRGNDRATAKSHPEEARPGPNPVTTAQGPVDYREDYVSHAMSSSRRRGSRRFHSTWICSLSVIPAQAGIQGRKGSLRPTFHHWIPAQCRQVEPSTPREGTRPTSTRDVVGRVPRPGARVAHRTSIQPPARRVRARGLHPPAML